MVKGALLWRALNYFFYICYKANENQAIENKKFTNYFCMVNDGMKKQITEQHFGVRRLLNK